MTDQYLIQAGGAMLAWSNPDNTFKKTFLVLNPLCEPDAHAGVVIIAQSATLSGSASIVENLRSELPTLLSQQPSGSIAFWWKESNADKRLELLKNLSNSPVYADYSHLFPSHQ